MSRRLGLWLVVAVLAVGVAAPAFSALVPPSGDEALVYVSVSPCAIFDTRTASAGQMTSLEIRSFGIVGSGDFSTQGGSASGCGVPGFDGGVPQAQAVLLNLVAISPQGGGNLKAWAGDAAEATGGVVNYQALSPSMNNSNAIVVGLNQTTPGDDITVKVNGAAVHVRGVVLGYFVSGNQTFLTLDGYDPDRDGTVTNADMIDGIDLMDWEQSLRSPLDSAGDVGWYTSIAIGADNVPVVSYFDATNGDLKVVHCTNAACTATNTPQTLDSTGDVGRYTSVAIGVDNVPVVSYYDDTNGDLKVVHCTNRACTTWDSPQTVDSTGVVGGYTSIAIGADNLPIISYVDPFIGDLKVVHCANTACTTWDAPQTLDSAGNVGWDISIAIGSDNLPVISYHDFNNGDLKVARVAP